eukprot:11227328-Lingulodinium_polyedra.AAC.1
MKIPGVCSGESQAGGGEAFHKREPPLPQRGVPGGQAGGLQAVYSLESTGSAPRAILRAVGILHNG